MLYLLLFFNKKFTVISLPLILIALFYGQYATAIGKYEKPKLVIVLDDIGHQRASAEAALALPGRLTLALLPFTPFSKEVALKASDFGKEVILHSPMSAISASKDAGLGTLTSTQDEKYFLQTFNSQLNFIPSVRGVSNHMGSALTSQRIPMRRIMEQLKMRNLYFLDSRTTNLSVAAEVAQAYGVQYLERKFFLDNIVKRQAISKKIEEAVSYARKEGHAVAIGHPYPQTLIMLSEKLPEIERNGVDLVWASEALEENFKYLSDQ
ncbi:MAG: divergent polysaccharide deacetylase family protein [Halieaceae bacterium]|nr:divergent polysaccharide deacetylase family protein [Halieaceae bacterium]